MNQTKEQVAEAERKKAKNLYFAGKEVDFDNADGTAKDAGITKIARSRSRSRSQDEVVKDVEETEHEKMIKEKERKYDYLD